MLDGVEQTSQVAKPFLVSFLQHVVLHYHKGRQLFFCWQMLDVFFQIFLHMLQLFTIQVCILCFVVVQKLLMDNATFIPPKANVFKVPSSISDECPGQSLSSKLKSLEQKFVNQFFSYQSVRTSWLQMLHIFFAVSALSFSCLNSHSIICQICNFSSSVSILGFIIVLQCK